MQQRDLKLTALLSSILQQSTVKRLIYRWLKH